MGDEADADWDAGLVEWGIEDAKEYYRDLRRRVKKLESEVKTLKQYEMKDNRRR